jgi:DNA-binding beta-propeller fold protein YncE/mono/diheme cytochrome c family protein
MPSDFLRKPLARLCMFAACLALGWCGAVRATADEEALSQPMPTRHAGETPVSQADAPQGPSTSTEDAAEVDLRLARLDRSPVDLVLTPDQQRLITANQTSHTLSLVELESGQVLQEVSCGARPAGLALSVDGTILLATAQHAGEVYRYRLRADRLEPAGRLHVGGEPVGVVMDRHAAWAYVALEAEAAVAVLDLAAWQVVERIPAGRWPRYLALTPDGSRLAVGASGDQAISVIDVASRQLLYQEKCGALNIGHLQCSADGTFVYFPWMIYRQNPIYPGNIQAGWVLASRIARVRMDGPARRQAISLDPRGRAVADPFGLVLTSDQQYIVATASGTQELLVYRMAELVFQDHGGPGDHIDPRLLVSEERFARIPLGGRPMAVRLSADDRTAYVANYLENAVQVVDLVSRRLVRSIALGAAEQPSLARRGAAIFYDGRRSLDQWYSCHSCHYEGGTNATVMDTMNDGSVRTFKTVLPLYHLRDTPPWTWHGWQTDLRAAMRKSLTETMLGPPPTDEDVTALLAFLETLELAPRDVPDADAVRRGAALFASDRAACATCHSGERFTDGQIHDVGTGGPNDVYQGYNTPSLLGVGKRVRLLHDGRARSLEQLLTGAHSPEKVSDQPPLTAEELADLVAYLRSL